MAQVPTGGNYDVANSTGANVRIDINEIFDAILTVNSGASGPAYAKAYTLWADTSSGKMMIRNAANNAWIELFQLDGTLTLEDGTKTAPALAHRSNLNTGIFFSAANKFNVSTAGLERLELGTTTIFNEEGEDVDFRIEGDTEANLFYLNAGTNRIGIGTASPDDLLHCVSSDFSLAKFESTSAGDTGPTMILYHNSASPADNDFIGALYFHGNHSGGSVHNYSYIAAQSVDVTDGTEDSNLIFATSVAGATAERMRIENSNVGIGTTSPATLLHLSRTSTTAYSTTNATNDTTFLIVNAGAAGHATMQFQSVSGGTANTCQATISSFAESDSSKNTALSFSTRRNSDSAVVERMRIDSSGRVLIGVTTSYANASIDELQIGNNNSANQSGITIGSTDECAIAFADAGDARAGSITYHHGTDAMIFKNVGQNERMRIDSSGNVGIATTSGGGKLAILSNSSSYEGLELQTPSGDASGEFHIGVHETGTSNGRSIVFKRGGSDGMDTESMRMDGSGRFLIGTNTQFGDGLDKVMIESGTNGGRIAYGTSAGFSECIIASMHAYWADNKKVAAITFFGGSDTTNKDDGSIRFATSSADNLAERMRVSPGGTLMVGRTTTLGANELVTVHSDNGQGLAIGFGTGTNERRRLYMHSTGLYFDSTTNQAYLSAGGAWVDASDISIKKDIEDITYGITTIKNLKPRKYKMKADDEAQIGFIAQEMQEQVPEVVGGKEGSLGIAYGSLTAVLTKALQEAVSKIEVLETKVAALEAA